MQPWSPPPRVWPPPTGVRSSYEARNVWGPDPAPVVASLGTDTERRRAAVGDMLHALSCRRRCRTSGTVLAEPVVADQAGRRAADTAHGSQIAEYQAPQRYRGPCARQLLCRCCRHLGADGIGWPNCQPRRYYCCCTHCARLPVIHCAPCTRGEDGAEVLLLRGGSQRSAASRLKALLFERFGFFVVVGLSSARLTRHQFHNVPYCSMSRVGGAQRGVC